MGRSYSNSIGENNPNFRTGFCCGEERPSFYNSWQNMKSRCLRPSHPKFHRYGGRGISICEDWLDIKKFSEWAKSSGWKQGLTIDRIDNDGNYEPDNCRWISLSGNSRKKSTTKISLDQAAEIRLRIDQGDDLEDLAKEYAVVPGTIWFIKNNITHTKEMQCSKKIKEIRIRNKLKK